MDSVIKNFCCYSGKILEAFTHMEEPWLKTRRGLSALSHSNRIIEKELIGQYFIDDIIPAVLYIMPKIISCILSKIWLQ